MAQVPAAVANRTTFLILCSMSSVTPSTRLIIMLMVPISPPALLRLGMGTEMGVGPKLSPPVAVAAAVMTTISFRLSLMTWTVTNLLRSMVAVVVAAPVPLQRTISLLHSRPISMMFLAAQLQRRQQVLPVARPPRRTMTFSTIWRMTCSLATSWHLPPPTNHRHHHRRHHQETYQV